MVIPPQIATVFGGYLMERGVHPTSILFLNADYGLVMGLIGFV